MKVALSIPSRSRAFVAALFLLASPAWADPRDTAAAEAMFQNAKQALARGEVDVACARFTESYRLDPAPGTLLNLADCEEKRGRLATAAQTFRDSSTMFRPGDDRGEYAVRRAQALEARVPHVILRLRVPTGEASGVTVYRDDVELRAAALEVALPIDPGRHRFVVRVPGREDNRIEVDIPAGSSREIVLEVGRASAPPRAEKTVSVREEPPTKLPPRSEGSSRATWGYLSAGVGGAALLGGILATFVVADAASTYKGHCKDGVCDDEGMDAASRGKTFSIIAPLSFGIAALGLGAGTYLLLTKPSPQVASGGVSVAGTF